MRRHLIEGGFQIFFDPCEELGPMVPRYGFSAEFIWHHAAIDLFDEVFKAGSKQGNGQSLRIFLVYILPAAGSR